MKTEDIKKMALAWEKVQEAAKKKLDPVGKADADIDNDGDTDKSDEYLHNRRKAVSAAIKGKSMKEEEDRSKLDSFLKGMKDGKLYAATKKRPPTQYVMKDKKDVQKEEVEELDELSKKTLGSYVKKAAGDAVTKAYRAGDVRDKDSGKNYMKALGRQIGISTATSKLAKEEVELDEGKNLTDTKADWRSDKSATAKNWSHNKLMKVAKHDRSAEKEIKRRIASKEYVFANEEVELDELKKSTLASYIKKATPSAMDQGVKGMDFKNENRPKHFNKAMGRMMGIKKAADKLAKEEVENLDELKKSTLGSYVKKASTNQIGNTAAVLANKNDSETDRARRRIGNRMAGIAKATDKLTKEDTDMSMKEKLQLQKESILEREMTDAEMKKREDIVKGMKKNKADFEKRYGSRAKNVMYATATKQAMESVDNALSMTKNFLTKEEVANESTVRPVYARIKENRAMQTKGATPPETMDDKMTASDKAFIAPHGSLNGVDSGIDGAKAAEYTAKNATTGIKPGGGMNRTGDQKTGDKNIIKSTEAK